MKTSRNSILIASIVAVGLAGGSDALAADHQGTGTTSGSTKAANHSDHGAADHNAAAGARGVAPDNTGRNVRDRNDGAVTADSQGNSQREVEVVSKARAALMDDDTLSTNAQNVKVILPEGEKIVVLKGPVDNALEKGRVEQIVRQAVQPMGIRSELEVVPADKDSNGKDSDDSMDD